MPERSDGAGQLADGDDLARTADPLGVARQLGVPQRQLETEGHRLGVHAVRAPDHRGTPMLFGTAADSLLQGVEILQDEIARRAHLQRLGGVDDVGRRQAEMEPPRRRANVLRHRGRKRDHVVLGCLLDFLDAGDVEGATLPDITGGVGRDDSGARHRVRGGNLYLQPRFVLVLVAPHATHFRVGIASDHRPRVILSERLGGVP
jgi:hypothetical protein